MKNKKFIVGTSVIVTLRDGKEIHGTIVSFGLSQAFPPLTLD